MKYAKANRENDFKKAREAMDTRKYRLAFRLSLKNVIQGHPEFFLNLGLMYSQGRGVRRSHQSALYWYNNKALKSGPPQFAASNIASEYWKMGRYQLAEEWYLKAAKLGDDDAWLELAHLYLSPLKDQEKAINALEKVTKSVVHETVTGSSMEKAKRLLLRLN